MKNLLAFILILLLSTTLGYSQVGGACVYMLPDSTIQCYVTGNAGIGSQNACFSNAIAAGAIPINCLSTPFSTCATFYSTNGVACFFGGTGSCGGGSPCSIIYLPIELFKFEGHSDNGKNRIMWWTASEMNNDYFILERSSDGINFEEIRRVDGAGNSTEIMGYEITDNYYERGVVNYYRLTQVDFDGQREVFKVIAIDNASVQKTLVRSVNLMGQEVGEYYRGFVINVYSDGTTSKELR